MMRYTQSSSAVRTTQALALALAAAACTADTTQPVPTTALAALVSEGKSDAQSRQGELARRVALALRDPDLRQRVKVDMRDAPMKEFKLRLTDYLIGASGSKLLASVAQSGATSENAVLGDMRGLPQLEFYMPVAEHRKKWRGEDNLIVATQIEDTDDPIAWDLTGKRVKLSLAAPPETPVLVIVPVETDFSRKLTAVERAARGDPKRETIEDPAAPAAATTYGLVCDTPSCGGGTGTPLGLPAGLYITFQRLVDMGEPWTLGAPEIEVHVHGPIAPGAPQYGADLACSGDRVSYPRGFNQDNAFWSGEALIFDQAQINNYNAIQQSGFNVSVWEDDNNKCETKQESFNLAARFSAIGTAVGGYAAVTAATGIGPTVIAAGTFVAAVYQSLTFLWTNDDFLGTYVNAAAIGASYADANHVLYKDGGLINGRAMLVSKAAR
ncbi:MAG: hypothetical protein ABIS29_00780 [Vicinamibacterales bacterium]